MKEIDWNRRWQECRSRRTSKAKGSGDWDRKASSFARRNRGAVYTERLVELIDPPPGSTILDVGAGPGTLAIPLARRVKKVTALDFSGQMLAELEKAATREGIDNIRTVQASWTDDWQEYGVGPHDIAVASRSLSVDDLQGALVKLDKWSAKKVFISDRVGTGPFDPEVFDAVGREFEPGPDYIYTVNLLHQMGIYAHIDFIEAEYSRTYQTREEAIDSSLWMLDGLREGEEPLFNEFMADRLEQLADNSWCFVRRHTPKWAIIWWDKEENS